jgi:hypothetical protein
LPLATGRSLRGEDSTQSSFQTQPIPALTGFQVQPRSLAMFRAEQMASLPGTVSLTPTDDGPSSIVNESGLDLKDAWVIRVGPEKGKEFVGLSLGSIAAGAKIPLGSLAIVEPKAPNGPEQLDPGPFLDLLWQRSIANRPEEVGELRLIAWADKPLGGQSIDPPVDRQRGFTLLVAHLQPSPLLDPASLRYNALAGGPEKTPNFLTILPQDPNAQFQGMGMRGRRPSPYTMPGTATPPPPATYTQPQPQPPTSPGQTPSAPNANSTAPEIPRP